MSKFFIKCDEANHVCDKSQYKEASVLEKLKLTIHLIYCSFCRKYSKNNAKLTECVEKSKIECLDNSVKIEMKENLKKELANQQH